jgi:hypothetical protein
MHEWFCCCLVFLGVALRRDAISQALIADGFGARD